MAQPEKNEKEFGFQGRPNSTRTLLSMRREEISKDLARVYEGNFQLIKKDLIDVAFSRLKLKSIAELGCVWGVDGAYGRYIAEKYNPDKVVMVDLIWNEQALSMCKQHRSIQTLDANFCDVAVMNQVGNVDAVIFFDLLLHLVNPDWNSVLRMYAQRTSSFLIVNPQYFGSDTTIRLWDLDRDIYFQNVPHNPTQKSYARTLENPYEFDKSQQKILRDAAYVWQWGITNHDLIDVMDRLGFDLMFLKRGDIVYGKAKKFVDHAFLFVKRSEFGKIVIGAES
jgi:hypothetical protein